MQMRKHPVRDAEGVRPDQPGVFLDTPAISYIPADYLLAVRGATKHKPLQGKQLRSGRKFDISLPAQASAVEDDGFLREPCKFRVLTYPQPGRNARGFIQSTVNFFSRLRCHRDGSSGERDHLGLDPVATRNTARDIYENSLFDRAAVRSREHDPNRRSLKEVHNECALF